MKNKTLKIIFTLIAVLLIIMLPNLAKADVHSVQDDLEGQIGGGTPDDTSDETSSTTHGAVAGADKFLNSAVGSPINQSATQEASNTLANTLLIVGVVAAGIVSVALGIKFMTGSVSEKAQVKQVAIPFVAGCILVFGGYIIWRVVVTLLSNLE